MTQKRDLRWRSAWLITGWAMIVAVIYLSLAPISVQAVPGGSDKLQHLVAYGALMVWFCQVYESASARVYLCTGLFLLGVSLEYAQGLTGYRSFEYADIAMNACGVAAGWIAAPPRIANLLMRFESLVRERRPL